MTSISMPDSIGTPEKQLQITAAEVEDYLSGERLHPEKAQIAVQQMHSMQDWTIQHRLTDYGCKNGDDFRNQIYTAEPRLNAIRDFANATKHGGFLKNSNRVLDEVKMAGDFSRAYSRDYDRVRMELHVTPGTTLHAEGHRRNDKYLEMDEVLKECLEFWTSLYETSQMPNNHPDRQEVGAASETHRHRVQLPHGIDSTAD